MLLPSSLPIAMSRWAEEAACRTFVADAPLTPDQRRNLKTLVDMDRPISWCAPICMTATSTLSPLVGWLEVD